MSQEGQLRVAGSGGQQRAVAGSAPGVLQREVLVGERRAVECGLVAGAVPADDIAALAHEAAQDPVDHRALVAVARLVLNQLQEVPCLPGQRGTAR